MRPPTAPTPMATTRPINGLLKNQVPATAAKAPISMNPSSAILVTPGALGEESAHRRENQRRRRAERRRQQCHRKK